VTDVEQSDDERNSQLEESRMETENRIEWKQQQKQQWVRGIKAHTQQ
jgi:hypothetical protein